MYPRLIAGIRAKMKDGTAYLQTHTMEYEILAHAHRFCMAKQLTTDILRIRTSSPFANNILRYFIVHLQILSLVCAVIVRFVITSLKACFQTKHEHYKKLLITL